MSEPTPDLVAGIVQDHRTGEVLMLAYLDALAMAETRRTGLAHFWSRSRRRLWKKGETSGNTLRMVTMAEDCDGDALLIRVEPAGPACHTGARTCFTEPGNGPGLQGFAGLEALWDTIRRRAAERPDGSYTAALLDMGVDGPARKVIEEAAEVAFAAKDHAAEDHAANQHAVGGGGSGRVAEEAADLIYHLLVLLAERGVDPAEVLGVLDRRAG